MIPPLRIENCDQRLQELFETRVEHLVYQTLDKYHISHTVMHLDRWYQRHDESSGKDTLIIYTLDTNTASWGTAAKAVLSLFQESGPAPIVGNMQVEIRNKGEIYNDCSRALPNDSHLIHELSQIEDKVFDIVEELMRGSWSSIAYHLRVDRRTKNIDEGKPTVIVFCTPGSSCNFEAAEDKFMEVLNTASYLIHLEFLPGKVTLLPNEGELPIHVSDDCEKPRNGSSLSIKGNTRKAGSLGGWMFLNPSQGDVPAKCALTCYHVIRSDDEMISSHTDKHGVMLNDSRGHVVAESPAAFDLGYTLKELNKIPTSSSIATECAQRHQKLLSLDPRIGSVILASGHRVADQRRLDWALIASPSTFKPNKPPSKSHFKFSPKRLPAPPELYKQNEGSKVRHIGRAKKDDWVTKLGRSTGITSGRVNSMRRTVYWEEHQETTFETEILSSFEDFAQPGDSGSMVLNTDGELVGLVFATDAFAREFDVTFMTPIHLIQQDVEHMSGGGYVSLD